MELTALALWSAAQKLRPYFQAHPVVVLTDPAPSQHSTQDGPNRKNASMGHIAYPAQGTSEKVWWTLRVDGASRSSGSGVGLLLQSPTEEQLEQAIRLGFPASNNEAEYETILSGLDLALALSVSKLRVYSDSQLVVRHVQKEYEAKDARMARYLAKVRDTLHAVHQMDDRKIKRTENRRADALAGITTSLPIKKAILLPIHVQANPSVPEASICNTIEANQVDGQEWTNDIIKYLRQALCPNSPSKHARSRGHKQDSNHCLKEKARASQRKMGGGATRRPMGLSNHTGRPIGNTPFALAYGMDAIIPTEIGLPTIQTRQESRMMQIRS
ncbi:hypothetical protein CK203_051833 [Vitis vinifera]|uniref:RNase H type-1 domain-containing protein n=1 Tax=Vitis vinifera TaxID=29760 RepID=A0A438GUN3_VITVI|nr:hypothetical protein CK203_051833 [Vitis vinifera]